MAQRGWSTADSRQLFPERRWRRKTDQLSFPKVISTLHRRAGLAPWSRLSVCGVACLYECMCACLWKEARAGPDPAQSSLKTEKSGAQLQVLQAQGSGVVSHLIIDPWFSFDQISIGLGNSGKDLRYCPESPET